MALSTLRSGWARLTFFLVFAMFGAALHAQPVMPGSASATSTSTSASSKAKVFSGSSRTFAASIPTTLTVDTANREEVRLFYRAIYPASENIAMGWTGNYTAGDVTTAAGDTSAAFKDAVNLRVNFFRALAGVPAGVTFSATNNAQAQKAALMMSANNALSHTPPSSWIYYSAEGATAASSSDLALGVAGPSAIDGYIADPGSNNAVVGHRRWALYPQTQVMGTGDVAGNGTLSPANALWVFDANLNGTRPFVRDSFVAWPAAGYMPYQFVYPRWSVSYPGANFSGATVTMTRDGVSIPVAVAPVTNGYGENTLVWTPDNLDATSSAPLPRPSADTTYDVTVSNVVINGAAQTFNYSVIVFDPDVAGADAEPVAITGSAAPDLNAANTYTVGGLYYASGFQWRTLTTAAYATVEGAENGSSGFTATTTGSYTATQTSIKASGSAAFHLAHPTTASQYVTLAPTFVGSAGAQLSFQSRLGYAMPAQTARVQVSLDQGASWMDVYTQDGTGGAGETGFTQRSVSLSSLDGRTFQVRFAYTFTTGSYYPGTATGIGWYFDDITFTGVSSATVGSTSATSSGNQFSYTPSAAGTYALQARGVFYGQYPLDWGPVKTVTVTQSQPTAPAIITQPASQGVTLGDNVTFSVVATGSPTPSYQWRKNGNAINGATSASLTLLNVQASDAASYSVVVSNSSGSVTSNSATLGVTASAIAPVIVTQPVDVNVLVGGTATLFADVTANPAPTYQWAKNGSSISGATGSAFNITNAQAGDAGSYSVTVTNSQGSTVSASATVTVSSPASIDTQPASVTVAGGSTPTLSVGASGSNLWYQWFVGASGDTSTPIAGANASSFTPPPLGANTQFWVRVSSPVQSLDSDTATVTVTGTARYFFGTFGSASNGTFGLLVRANNSAVFLAAFPTLGSSISSSAFTIAGDGTFSFVAPGSLGTVSGQVSGTSVSGTISGPGFSFSGTQDAGGGSSAAYAGNYSASIVNTSNGAAQILAGPNGSAFVLAGEGGTVSGVNATISSAGAINATLPDGRTIALNVSGALIKGTTAIGGVTRTVSGAREDAMLMQRIVNISVRAQVKIGAQIMIAGFVISGPGYKNVLIRGIGPKLSSFNVPDTLANPMINVYRQSDPVGSPPIASNDDWGNASNATQIIAVSHAVQAFSLNPGSQDAVVLLRLPAGAYTAQVSGVGGTSGAALVEIYDADEAVGEVASANLSNISMRGDAGNGDSVVITGFVVTGSVPKRVLIRGVGPELEKFGVSGTLANPIMHLYRTVNSVSTEIAANDNWGDNGQQAVVQAANTQTQAFGLTPDSQSAAMVIWLEPGVYTAQVSSVDSTTGVAITEVYEVP